MSRPIPRWIAFPGVLLALLGLELSYWVYMGTGVYVEVVNRGNNDLRNVRVQADGRPSRAGSIAPGRSTRVFMSASKDSPLYVEYQQPDGTSAKIVIPMVDYRYLRAQGRKFVLEMEADQFVQYSEEDEGRVNRLKQLPGRARRTLSRWTFGLL